MVGRLLLQFVTIMCAGSYANAAFHAPSSSSSCSLDRRTSLMNKSGDGNDSQDDSSSWNPFKGPKLDEMMSRVDDAIDDFMGKRMGNGEVFYGKRKFEPSGRENTDGEYMGMGRSDKIKIDTARERKEEIMEQRRRQAEE